MELPLPLVQVHLHYIDDSLKCRMYFCCSLSYQLFFKKKFHKIKTKSKKMENAEQHWLLSIRVFGLLSSSLLLFPQRFGRYVLQPSSGVCRTREPSRNFATPVDSIKDVVRSSVKVPEFDKHLKKAGGHIGRNVVEITIKMKTIVWKPLMIKINKLHQKFRQLIT